jgi:hypothetical protein
MNGLVSSPAPLPDPAGASVEADGWFPAITVASVRDRVRLGSGALTHEMLLEAIEGAMLHAFRELAVWRSARASEGKAALDQVTTLQVNGRNRAVVLWERIVRYFAAAELFAENRDISATDRGLDRAEEKESSADEFRRNALAAVADLRSLGVPAGEEVARNRVDLI